MADKQRRQLVWLAILLAVLAVVLVWRFRPRAGETSGGPRAARAVTPATGARSRAAGAAAVAPPPHVNLEALEGRREDPTTAPRNPFRMQAAVPPPEPAAPPPVTAASPAGGATGVGPSVPEPPPPPPISFKFIGTVAQSSSPAGRIAVLSDGKYVYYGREGDIIEGRYRLVKIGEESLQIEHVDGRGRQTLRLSGS